MSEVALHPDVPFGMHPERFDVEGYAVMKEGPHGPRIVSAATSALTVSYGLYSNMENTEALLKKSESGPLQYIPNPKGYGPDVIHVPNGREHEYLDIVTKAHKKTTEQMWKDVQVIEEVQGYLQKEVDDVLKNPDRLTTWNIAMATEVRQYARSLNEDRRRMLLDELIHKDDRATFSFIIDAPPFLSGLDDEHVSIFRQQAQEKWAPVAYKQLELSRDIRDVVMWAGNELTSRLGVSLAKMTGMAQASRALAEMRGML